MVEDIQKSDQKKEDVPACCGEVLKKEDNKEKDIQSTDKTKKNPNQILIKFLVAAVVVNILVMGYFIFSVNSKLNYAIEQTKPQKGELTLVLPMNCPLCGDMSDYVKKIKDQNIELSDQKTVYVDTDDGNKIIEEFDLKKLPALVFVSKKEIKSQVLKTIEKDSRKVGEKSLVWEKSFPPQMDVETKDISGLVNVIYLSDKWCSGCYDPGKIHKPILLNLGLAITSEEVVDDIYGKEGGSLIAKYNITSVPTVILSSGAGDYEVLNSLWPQIGTIEDDGSFVFRQMEALNVTYRDLKTDKVIDSKTQIQ